MAKSRELKNNFIGINLVYKTNAFFELTAYMAEDEEFEEFWKLIYEEYKTTKRLLLKIADHTELMENYPDGKASLEIREDIVLPLLTI